ncbi:MULTISPECIES: ribbon-helix-helix domain-containing protein [unclassified Bosea (in: a-proteobacteria)]|uniref:ribbon-helix-helix domain-containing protein n=1 Tax=unclassified Bosea (in: a-proteobacteria) TaxID=2653178 RepID=UPI000F75E4E1|nr:MULTISPECIES: ribbon-helix-helix domain-containing protein [unclassified Bosea (in: a-proteobacteria)]AZO76802.1 aryl-sulfate sulfotransferase [Bosea sp. Tri-49]RXT21636.1 aryl-sulfate sulfotransferase [Bosea sp. Tri-39]RXT31975.1 aryl-sulfate sulfotransferase [Bosea sp. Tri-54]
MCKLFISADADLWRTRLKSVRLNGFSTSVRLENLYWRVLEEIAARDGMSLGQLLAKLHGELIETHGDGENFASFLRVCCGRYLMLQLAGDVPRELDRPIRELDADSILAREAQRLAPATRRPQRPSPSGASLSARPVP